MGDTAEMWGDMLGIGPILTTLKDPQFFAQVNALFLGLIELDKRTVRLEAKLDLIAERIGVDFSRLASGPAVPPGNGATGPGPTTATGGVADDGTRDAAEPRRIARG